MIRAVVVELETEESAKRDAQIIASSGAAQAAEVANAVLEEVRNSINRGELTYEIKVYVDDTVFEFMAHFFPVSDKERQMTDSFAAAFPLREGYIGSCWLTEPESTDDDNHHAVAAVDKDDVPVPADVILSMSVMGCIHYAYGQVA